MGSHAEMSSGPCREEATRLDVAARHEPHEIDNILSRVDRDSLGLVQAADLLEQALLASDLLYVMEINPRQVGFDPCNRDGCGGNYQEVHLLLNFGINAAICIAANAGAEEQGKGE